MSNEKLIHQHDNEFLLFGSPLPDEQGAKPPETAKEVFQEIVETFVRRGGTRPDAIQFVERNLSSTAWSNIADSELRGLIERYHDAMSTPWKGEN